MNKFDKIIERLNKELNLNLQSARYSDIYNAIDEEYNHKRCELLSDDYDLYYEFENFYIKFDGYFDEGFFICKHGVTIIELKDMDNIIKEKLKEVSKEI